MLCHSPDRLARRYAYQVLLLEELPRAGVDVYFVKEPERGGTPEDELLRQFQGMIAEYERAQIAERTRRGKLHRARGGSQVGAVAERPTATATSARPTSPRPILEIEECEAEVVREIFRRYAEQGRVDR